MGGLEEGGSWAAEVYGKKGWEKSYDASMDFEICNRYLWYWGSLEASICFAL